MYFIPGSLSNWNTNYELDIFSYFLYNIDTDPSESFNLLDIVNINYVSYELKNKLNDVLNLSLEEKNCNQLKTILLPLNYTVIPIPITTVLHLKTAITALPCGTALIYPPSLGKNHI
jgi:hypothetical protein